MKIANLYKLYAPLLIVDWVLWVTLVVFSSLSTAGVGPFKQSMQSVSDQLSYIDAMPLYWANYLWIPAHLWQALWLAYAGTAIYKSGMEEGKPLYRSPGLISPLVLGAYGLVCAVHIGFLFLRDHMFAVPVVIFLCLMSALLVFALTLALWVWHRYLMLLHKYDLEKEAILVTSFLHNGLAFYTGWCVVSSFVGIGVALVKNNEVHQMDASTAALSIIVAITIIWFWIEIIFLDNHMRYVVAEYVPGIVILAGVVAKKLGGRNYIFAIVVLAVISVIAVSKLVVLMWRHRERPILTISIRKSATAGGRQDDITRSRVFHVNGGFPENTTTEEIMEDGLI